jgi:hypothetical protein
MLSTAGAPTRSWAMLAPAKEAGVPAGSPDREKDLKAVQSALESEVVRRRLADFKLTPEEIDGRLRQMSDEQVHQAALQVRAMNPGGDLGGVLVVVLLVMLIIYLARRI